MDKMYEWIGKNFRCEYDGYWEKYRIDVDDFARLLEFKEDESIEERRVNASRRRGVIFYDVRCYHVKANDKDVRKAILNLMRYFDVNTRRNDMFILGNELGLDDYSKRLKELYYTPFMIDTDEIFVKGLYEYYELSKGYSDVEIGIRLYNDNKEYYKFKYDEYVIGKDREERVSDKKDNKLFTIKFGIFTLILSLVGSYVITLF